MGRPGLPFFMRTSGTAACITAAVVIAVASCGPVRYGTDRWERDWIDPHTLRITAVGAVRGSDAKIAGAGRFRCERAAVDMAKKIIVDRFTSARLERLESPTDYDEVRAGTIREFGGVIEYGRVVERSYGKDRVCRVVYEISSENLKRRVLAKTTGGRRGRNARKYREAAPARMERGVR